jgi:hypothetical protein
MFLLKKFKEKRGINEKTQILCDNSKNHHSGVMWSDAELD